MGMGMRWHSPVGSRPVAIPRRYQILGFLIIIHFTREVHYSLLICVCEQRRSYNIWNQGASRDLGGACVVKKTFCKEIYFYLVPCNPLASFRSAAVCEVWRIIHMLVCCFFIVFFFCIASVCTFIEGSKVGSERCSSSSRVTAACDHLFLVW
jgi:hypothetical protein